MFGDGSTFDPGFAASVPYSYPMCGRRAEWTRRDMAYHGFSSQVKYDSAPVSRLSYGETDGSQSLTRLLSWTGVCHLEAVGTGGDLWRRRNFRSSRCVAYLLESLIFVTFCSRDVGAAAAWAPSRGPGVIRSLFSCISLVLKIRWVVCASLEMFLASGGRPQATQFGGDANAKKFSRALDLRSLAPTKTSQSAVSSKQ